VAEENNEYYETNVAVINETILVVFERLKSQQGLNPADYHAGKPFYTSYTKVGWIQEIDEKTGMILIKSQQGLSPADYLLVSKENIVDVEEKRERDLG